MCTICPSVKGQNLRRPCFSERLSGALAMASRLIILAVALGVALHGLAAAAVAAIAGLTCNGITFMSYTDLPSFNTQGSHDSVIVQIGAGAIDGGSTLTVSDIFFDLACRHKGCSGNVNQNCSVNANCPSGQLCLDLLPGTCVPDGSSPGVNSVAGFVGVVSNNCTDARLLAEVVLAMAG
jgi:hypothetical protein